MLDTTIAYPEFVPNQILTDAQLNQLREHLEQQDRHTRLRLAGTGIACGLVGTVVRTGTRGISITAGYGLTSDGDLIELCPAATYTHFRTYTDPDRDEDGKLRYAAWRLPTDATNVTQLPITELVSAATMAGAEPPDATSFTAGNLDSTIAGRVLVLYLEHEPVDLNSCLVTSCDNKGRNINVNLRVLLVRASDLAPVVPCPPAPVLQRIRRLPAIARAASVNAAFGQVVTDQAPAVGAAIKALFDTHAAFLSTAGISAADPLAGKLTGSEIAQYRYGALQDFAGAYNEAAVAAYELVRECCPAGTFPRHLMLSRIDNGSTDYRQRFSPAAIRDVMYREIDRVNRMFRRLSRMISFLNLAAHPAAVTIRPSHAATHALGRRARPFYFSATEIGGLWRPAAPCTVDDDWPWVTPPTAVSFDTDYLESTLLRIEGHVGMAHSAAATAVTAARTGANVEFALLRSYLDDDDGPERSARAELKDLMLKGQALWTEARALFRDGLFGDIGAIADSVAALARKQTDFDAALDSASRGWLDLRARRVLHCDVAALGHDYFEARAELLCLGSRLRGAVTRLRNELELVEDEAIVGEGLDALLESAPYALIDQVAAMVLAQPAAFSDAGEVESLKRLPDMTPPRMVKAALLAALASIDGRLNQLTSTVLPLRLADFDYDLFAYRFRILAARVREFAAWAGALQVSLSGSPIGAVVRDTPLHKSQLPALEADLLAMQGCVQARLLTMWVGYEAARAKDLSLFDNLKQVDGLEHRAGVTPGGTFILLCESPASTGKVIADFSLDGRLPCCCDVDLGSLCLPPLAMPDVRIVTIPSAARDDKTEIEFLLAVGPNDCDVNLAGSAQLTVQQGLDAEGQPLLVSELGAKIEADPANGVIRYTLEPAAGSLTHESAGGGPMPGLIDRFSYRVRLDGKCEGDATGDVIIVYTAEPVVDGRIEGEVIISAEEPAPYATVTIRETGQTIVTGAKGLFTFDHVLPGTYSLQATLDDRTSDVEEVTVVAEQTSEVLLTLREKSTVPTTGTVAVQVIDVTGKTQSGVPVTLLNLATGVSQTSGTDGAGVARFVNVTAPQDYLASATVPGMLIRGCEPTPIPALAAQTVAARIIVEPTTPPAPPTVVVTGVATDTGISTVDASRVVRETMIERYGRWTVDLGGATDDPRISTSETYLDAGEFIVNTVNSSGMTDAAVAEAYAEVSAALSTAAKGATGRAKVAYQDALTSVSAAYLDRIAMANPKTLSADGAAEVKVVAAALKTAGVDMNAAKETWGSTQLTETMGVKSVEAMEALLK